MDKQKINEIEINGTVYVPKNSAIEMAESSDGLKPVLIRSYAAGVHFGYLKSEEFTAAGKVVTLLKSRRVWYWDGAASLSQMAVEGVNKPENCKFSMTVNVNEIVNVIETIPLTKVAFENLLKVAIWKQ